jgi:hypothetical protein
MKTERRGFGIAPTLAASSADSGAARTRITPIAMAPSPTAAHDSDDD